jgi:DDE superfamily endonuclease
MLQKEFPAKIAWFKDLTVKLDLGFQGFADLYSCKKLVIPFKKKRAKKGVSNDLSEDQVDHNKQVGSERIYVEHAIGGMKRYRILEHRNRLKSTKIINQVIGVCAALWNFHLLTT